MDEAEKLAEKRLHKFALEKAIRRRLMELIRSSIASQQMRERDALNKGEHLHTSYCWEVLNKGESNGNIDPVVKSGSVL
jgi:hypothetical protein